MKSLNLLDDSVFDLFANHSRHFIETLRGSCHLGGDDGEISGSIILELIEILVFGVAPEFVVDIKHVLLRSLLAQQLIISLDYSM